VSLLPAALRDAIDLAPRAIEGGLLAGAACGAAGVVLRWRRLVWAGFAVPEAATAGTSFALGNDTLLPALGVSGALPSWLGWEPMWSSSPRRSPSSGSCPSRGPRGRAESEPPRRAS